MESLLEYRINNEETIMEKLSSLQGDLRNHIDKLDAIITTYQKLITEPNKNKSIEAMKHYLMYKEKVNNEIDSEKNQITEIKNTIEKTRQELVEAQKHRKIMEKLKEQDYNKYKEVVKKYEQKELDELGVLRYKRANSDG